MLPAALAAAALAFWAPTTAQQAQACPTGVNVQQVAHVTPGMVTWDNAAGTEDLNRVIAFAPQQKGACAITINMGQWPHLTAEKQCATMVHELGHSVMGLGHVNDGRNVMNASIVDLPWCDALVAHEPATMLRRFAAKVHRLERRHRKHLKRSTRAHAVTVGAADDMFAGYRPELPADMAAHGITWMRLVAYQGELLDRVLQTAGQARAAGLNVSVVLTPRYGAPVASTTFASWASATSARLADVGVDRVSLLNEPDLWLQTGDRCDTDSEVRSTLRSEHVTSKRVRAWRRSTVRRWRMVHVHHGWHFRRVAVRVRRRVMAVRITHTPTSTENVSLTPRWGCLEIHRARLAADIWRQAIPAVRAAAPGMSILIGETSPVTGVGLFLQALPDRLPQADGWAHHPYPSSTVELGLDHASRLGHPYGLPVYWTEFGTHVRTDEHAQPISEARSNWTQAVHEADRLGVRELDVYGYLRTGKGWDTAAEGVLTEENR